MPVTSRTPPGCDGAVGLEARQHLPDLECEPGRAELTHLLLRPVQIVTAVADGLAQRLGPDLGERRAGQRVGAHEVVHHSRQGGLFPLPAQQFDHGGLTKPNIGL
jgi:hypothetical protein